MTILSEDRRRLFGENTILKLFAPIIRLIVRLYLFKGSVPKRLHILMERTEERIYLRTKLLCKFDMWVDPLDVVGGHIYRNGCFEEETVKLVEKILVPGMVFVDIGANIGQYSILGGKLVAEKGEVYAFEPDPPTCRLLRDNLKLNQLSNVSVYEVALSDTTGDAMLYKGQYCNTGANSLRRTIHNTDKTIKIATNTLDKLLLNCSNVDLIKVDVEGLEHLVFKGGEEIIKHHKPVIIMEVTSPDFSKGGYSSSEDAIKFLKNLRYNIYCINQDGNIYPFVSISPLCMWFNVVCIDSHQLNRWKSLIVCGPFPL